jgi:excisionase family DNA binding protein
VTATVGVHLERPWLTLSEAAAYLGKPASWMYDNTQRRRIPHMRLGREYRFRIDLLDEWLIKQVAV